MSRPVIFLILFLAALLSADDYSSIFYRDMVDGDGTDFHRRIVSALSRNTQTESVEVRISYEKISGALGGALTSAEIIIQTGRFNALPVKYSIFSLEKPVVDVEKLYSDEVLILKDCEKIDYVIEVLQDDLNSFLDSREESINVMDPHITLKRDQLDLRGYGQVLNMRVKFNVTGDFSVRDGRFIDFNPVKVRFNSIPLPMMVVHSMVKKINPVLDLRQFPFDLRIDKIIIEPGKLIFRHGEL